MTMHSIRLIPVTAIIASSLLMLGCDSMADRGTSPDNSAETKRAVSDIHEDAQIRKDAVDRERHEQLTSVAFKERQLNDRAKEQDGDTDLARDKIVQPLEIKIKGIKDQEETDREAVKNDLAAKLRTPGDQEAVIKADGGKRIAEIERTADGATAKVNREIDQANDTAKDKHNAIAQDLDRKRNNLVLEKENDERDARQRNLVIDRDATTKLDAIGQKSANATSSARTDDLRTTESDLHISRSIRDDVTADPALSPTGRYVDISTTKGVVVITGNVPTEADHQAIIAKARRVNGVTHVVDQLAVKPL